MPLPPMQIANWEEGFEIAQSRRREGRLNWVAMPTRHDSRGYRNLVRRPNGSSYFGCWCAMVQVAARSHIRGVLADDRGEPLTCEDLEAMTDLPKSDFEVAIPILCNIGWLLCPDSYPTTSTLGADSEQSTTTVHNSTVQTEHNKTANSSELFLTHGNASASWELIPKGRKIGNSKWRKAWAEVVEREQLDKKMVMTAILAYYESGEGQSEYFRQPATLLNDRIWEEEQESWNSKHKKPTDQKQVDAAFDRIFEADTLTEDTEETEGTEDTKETQETEVGRR